MKIFSIALACLTSVSLNCAELSKEAFMASLQALHSEFRIQVEKQEALERRILDDIDKTGCENARIIKATLPRLNYVKELSLLKKCAGVSYFSNIDGIVFGIRNPQAIPCFNDVEQELPKVAKRNNILERIGRIVAVYDGKKESALSFKHFCQWNARRVPGEVFTPLAFKAEWDPMELPPEKLKSYDKDAVEPKERERFKYTIEPIEPDAAGTINGALQLHEIMYLDR